MTEEAYVIIDSNNNALVLDTFDAALLANKGATPLCTRIEDFNTPIESSMPNLKLQE